jgi:hypothetical protein
MLMLLGVSYLGAMLARCGEAREGRGSFLKKRTKKLL